MRAKAYLLNFTINLASIKHRAVTTTHQKKKKTDQSVESYCGKTISQECWKTFLPRSVLKYEYCIARVLKNRLYQSLNFPPVNLITVFSNNMLYYSMITFIFTLITKIYICFRLVFKSYELLKKILVQYKVH